jgi:hypothetical protein
MSKLGRAPWVLLIEPLLHLSKKLHPLREVKPEKDLSQYLKEFPSPIVVKMKIMCVHIDEELNTSTIDFQ